MLGNLLYNVLLLVAVAALVFHLSRNRSLVWFIALGVTLAAAAVVIASMVGVGLEGSGFASMRLLCFGVFIHAPLYAAIGCFLLWRTSRVGAIVAGSSAVILAAIGVDAFFIEPQWLDVSHHEIRSAKITKPLRIAVIADIQTDDVGDYERDVLRRVAEEKPDLILLPGDYLQCRSIAEWQQQCEKLRETFREANLTTPLGLIAVEGNIDYDAWPNIFEGTNIVTTVETKAFDVDPGRVRVTGLSEPDSGRPDGASRLTTPADIFHICVGHRPDFAITNPQADLLIAGHTHGGQVQLPIVGPLLTLAKVPRSWAAGLTEIAPGQHLFVSRGIGMERGEAPRLRFLCRPELAIIDVVPE
jgi:uncharacterized protein